MSRIGKKPVAILDKVEVSLNGRQVTVKGPVGSLEFTHHPLMTVKIDTDANQAETLIDAHFVFQFMENFFCI